MFNLESNSDWNHGNLIYYGRADLKQSDHRPVIAIIDIEIQCVDETRRDQVFHHVIQELGPPDGTVIIHLDENDPNIESVMENDFMNSLVQNLSEMGEILLVRFVNNTIWITFRDGRTALEVAKKGMMNSFGHNLHLTLKSPDWVPCVEKEYFKNNESIYQRENLSYEEGDGNSKYYNKMVQSSAANVLNKSPPPRPAPPSRGSATLTTNINFPQQSSRAEKVDTPGEPSTIYEEITNEIPSMGISDNTNVNCLKKLEETRTNAPPLPYRKLPLPPPKVPPPVLPISEPPPIPARSSTAPPVPARNNV